MQLGSFVSLRTGREGAPVSLQPITLRINDFDVEHYGETDLSAQVYLVLNGQTVYSSSYTTSLRDMVENVNENVESYTQIQLDALAAWLARFSVVSGWKTDNIL